MEKKRIRDFGIVPGRVKTGKRNAITDVPGVLVGHCTVNTEENHTGVTVIIPGPDNAFANHYIAPVKSPFPGERGQGDRGSELEVCFKNILFLQSEG